jgi:ribonuclease BN (tRNA processing enzyme)
MRILLLGTGTPKPSLKRMGAGYLVEVGSDAILFDAGPGVFHRLLEAGIPATRRSHVFLSHLHYYHCMDYGRLVLTRWDQGHGRIPELRVFGPTPLSRMNAALFGPEGAFAPDIEARLHHMASVAVYVNRGGNPPRKRPAPEIGSLTGKRHFFINQ